jgi:hypothetical protein
VFACSVHEESAEESAEREEAKEEEYDYFLDA